MDVEHAVREWEARGEHRTLAGHRVFTMVVPSLGPETAEPLLVLHGFPTSSYDYVDALDALRRRRRVLLVDMLGYGLSDKPDLAYTLALQADLAQAFVEEVGVTRLALLTHDMGSSVGGELLARNAEGRWPVEVTRRVLTNGSIYIDMARLTAGQQLLLSLPDARLDPATAPDEAAITAALTATLSPARRDADMRVHAALVCRDGGNLVLARLVRYIEERRRAERRFTGAIETHPSPLGVVWGQDDPIAVAPMAEKLRAARPDATVVRLDGVGHYPMVEAPERFVAAVAPVLAPT